MDRRTNKYNIVEKRLALIKSRVELANSLNLTDLNIHAENFYRDLFNKLGFNFTNTNFDAQNAAHIDLIDTLNKQAIQITSRTDNKKIKEAIDGFYSKEEYKDYKLQLLLIGKDAKDYTTSFSHNFDHSKDVLDVKRLLAIINNFETDDIAIVADFLDNEILEERSQTESTEVETIMSLIDYLSKDENRHLTEKKDNVDPDFKINNRFANHASYLTSQYGSLYSVYNSALIKANEKMDGVMSIIISSYLKDESDALLSKNNNDPKAALAELVEYFYNKLSTNGFDKFDKQAIRYYLLDEMIKCNVFPN